MYIQNIVLLDGSGKIKEMVLRAKELGMDSLAITRSWRNVWCD